MRRKTLPCTEEEEEALLPLAFSFPNFMAAHGVGVAQAKPACRQTHDCNAKVLSIQYNTIRYDATRRDAMRCDTIRYDTIRYETRRDYARLYETR